MHDTKDEGKTDAESDDDSSSDDEEEIKDNDITAGDIVWGMYGRIWYPAQDCTLTDISENTRKLFRNNLQKLILKWYGEENFSLVKESKVERLAENKVDAQRASRSQTMQKLYNTTLADLLQ